MKRLGALWAVLGAKVAKKAKESERQGSQRKGREKVEKSGPGEIPTLEGGSSRLKVGIPSWIQAP